MRACCMNEGKTFGIFVDNHLIHKHCTTPFLADKIHCGPFQILERSLNPLYICFTQPLILLLFCLYSELRHFSLALLDQNTIKMFSWF